jgi:hypothetical protein
MKHIRVYQTPRNTTTVIINKHRHGNVTPASLARLVQIVTAEQTASNCDVTPNLIGTVGWTANIYSFRKDQL